MEWIVGIGLVIIIILLNLINNNLCIIIEKLYYIQKDADHIPYIRQIMKDKE